MIYPQKYSVLRLLFEHVMVMSLFVCESYRSISYLLMYVQIFIPEIIF